MSWCNKKQDCTTQSTMEAHSVACYHRDKSHCHKVYVHQKGDYVLLTKPIPSDTFKIHMLSLGIRKVQFLDISYQVMDKVLL